ncbi:MAG TPA: phosphopentomutase [bacterium]|nr:phosphopentomutase [bacterium]
MSPAPKQAVLLVIDGMGIGEAPDAHEYRDEGSNTLQNLAAQMGGLDLPNLGRLGLGNIADIQGVPAAERPLASYGRLREVSKGKDSTTGHWELLGLPVHQPFPTYPGGFPPDVIGAFEQAIGRQVLANKPASGTAVIDEYGPEHLATGQPIVYTSADSVFQIAAHTDVIPLDELYRISQIARDLLQGEHAVSRVIARPFVGHPGAFKRTYDRKDYSLPPLNPTLLDRLVETGYEVISVGKVDYLFSGQGITEVNHTEGNADGMRVIAQRFAGGFNGLMFCNLIDTDQTYGHRNDCPGYKAALEAIDAWLPLFLDQLPGDVPFLITSDHGNDPTTPSTDHSREYVPILGYSPEHFHGADLGTRRTFADVAATLADHFGLPTDDWGTSFLGH